jgi:hypothetical protein
MDQFIVVGIGVSHKIGCNRFIGKEAHMAANLGPHAGVTKIRVLSSSGVVVAYQEDSDDGTVTVSVLAGPSEPLQIDYDESSEGFMIITRKKPVPSSSSSHRMNISGNAKVGVAITGDVQGIVADMSNFGKGGIPSVFIEQNDPAPTVIVIKRPPPPATTVVIR